MKSILALFSLFASFFIASFSTAAFAGDLPQGDFKDMKPIGHAIVSNVIDPLTIELDDGRIVRLSGIDIPDLSYQDAGDFAQASLRVMQDMLLGQVVNLYQTPTTDKGRMNRMGHHLAHIERKADNAWAQGSLLAVGAARVRTDERTPQMARQMLGLESLARWEKTGIWEEESPHKVLSPEEAQTHLYRFAIVRGVIKSTASKSGRIYLNFGDDWREDFTISIPSGKKRAFSSQNIDPLQWGGQEVEARGWIDSYNGAFIEVTHPEAIYLTSLESASPDE